MSMGNIEALSKHVMTLESMEKFVDHEADNGASANMLRRFKGAVKSLYDYLPEDDKQITKERLQQWRTQMESHGYASMTVLNYVKHINRFLDYIGASEIRFNRGKGKDIAGMTFGYLTALEPTEKRNRKDIIWKCRCKCGKNLEIPATRLLTGSTLSCGCLRAEHFKRANMYIDNTSVRQALEEKVKSSIAVSGYTGVTPKRGKWKAYICYKGKQYSLGCYTDIEDAVKARARGKELVRADAMGLLDFYEELHKFDSALPSRKTEPKHSFPTSTSMVNDKPYSAATRLDNKSGHTGVSLVHNRWEARICHEGIRYILGSFTRIEDAIALRKQAEQDLKANPEEFAERYKQMYRFYTVRKKSSPVSSTDDTTTKY